MNALFLDIDGVLTKTKVFKSFDHNCVKALQKIMDSVVVSVILSSCWRHGFIDWPNNCFAPPNKAIPTLKRWFKENDLNPDSLISYTPFLRPDHRGSEIKCWLEQHPEVEHFVILDDDSYDIKDTFPNELVHTNSETGLTMEDAEKAISILTKE